jgi:hypothetical protein
VADPTDERLDEFAARIVAARGRVHALDLAAWESSSLIERISWAAGDGVNVALVLGAACTTATKAVDQFVAALQLPYSAARGWADFLESLGNRASALRQIVVVADAAQLLKHEDVERWQELVAELRDGPRCMGGGWNTLALVDHEVMWAQSVFGSSAGAQAAGTVG